MQRCTQHKWTNLKAHCLGQAHAAHKRERDASVRIDDGLTARAPYLAFVDNWTKLVPPGVRSLEEASLELLILYSLPKSMWKSLRKDQRRGELQDVFRRRTKARALLPTETAGVTLLWGLRRIRADPPAGDQRLLGDENPAACQSAGGSVEGLVEVHDHPDVGCAGGRRPVPPEKAG